ncbi:protein kinase [Shinella sp. H4-D48]|uniref:protein kinase domain-containing protein n=1 Tax=Shinella sp. H4-D48 TaxID=2925841 RepID=UPI001F534FBE|nr:protein kinase [Shinella sp. H4-D48]UNK37494.1 protein kinase [Shinella sp. H4-D48]
MHPSEVTRLEKSARKLAEAKQWEMRELLGHGASAAVFEVETADGLAALKIYHPNFLRGNEGVVSRARLALVQENLLTHTCPTLVRIFDCGEADGVVYMLMERVPGLCLTEALKLVPGDKIEGIVVQIARAAQYLESVNICHRDIKPDNIVVSMDFEKATLLDLGVVRLIDSDSGSGTDESGQLPFVATARHSSPEYMFRLWPAGPELWRALTFYQLGAVTHDLLAQEQLFEEVVSKGAGNRYLIAHAVATIVPTVPVRADAPSYLSVLAQRALQKDPSARLRAVSWNDFNQDRRRQNEIILGVVGNNGFNIKQSSINLHGVSQKIREFINVKLTENKVDCSCKVDFTSSKEFKVAFDWIANVNGGVGLRTDLWVAVGSETLTINGVARCKDRPLECKSPPVTIAYVAGHEVAIEEQCYTIFLECSALIVEKCLEQREDQAQ